MTKEGSFEYWKPGISESEKELLKKREKEQGFNADSNMGADQIDKKLHDLVEGSDQSGRLELDKIVDKILKEVSFIIDRENELRQKTKDDPYNIEASKWKREADTLRAHMDRLLSKLESKEPQEN